MSTKIKPKFSFKLLSVLLAVLMVISSFPVAAGSAFAAGEDEKKKITVEFKVTDSAEQPVNGAKITVFNKDNSKILTENTILERIKETYETDEKGEASFEIELVDEYE